MPFPKMKCCRPMFGGSSPRIKLITDPYSGIVSESVVPNNIPLPDRMNHKIGNMIKAGVTLKEVNTKVVSNFSMDEVNKAVEDVFAKSKFDKKDDSNSNKKDDK